MRTKPDLRFLFNDDEYRLTSQQKTLDFPYFPADTDFHFALQSDCPARITLCCFTTEKVIPKVEEDIDLGSGTQFNLEHQGQKYCCHASKESIFEFEINFGDWVPRCIKFGLSVGKTSLNRDELAGEMQVNGVSKKLDGWYQELTLEPPYLTSRMKVQLSMPLPRVCDVAWWPE